MFKMVLRDVNIAESMNLWHWLQKSMYISVWEQKSYSLRDMKTGQLCPGWNYLFCININQNMKSKKTKYKQMCFSMAKSNKKGTNKYIF